jgi:hypothetical protein
MHHLTELVTSNLGQICAPNYPRYHSFLENAFSTNPPPFAQNWFGRRYFELARNKEWFANSLVANSALEGYGATQVWNFSRKIDIELIAKEVQKHALDESRHSTMFVHMLNFTFPEIEFEKKTWKKINDQQPRYTKHRHPSKEKLSADNLMHGESLLNELVQINITEIRALVLQFLVREIILAHSPESSKKRLDKMTRTLIHDESAHIEYTAKIFEQAANMGHGEFLYQTFEDRVSDFNDLTLLELSREKVEI